MKATQVSPWLQMADAFQTLAAGFVKVDAVEKNGGFKLPTIQTQALPAVNGKTNGHTNGHSNGNGHHAAAKALPAPQKVKKAAVKALPAAPEAAKAKAKPAKETKAIVKTKAKKEPKAKKTAAATSPAIAAGRRAVADGLRPKLRDAIVIVMGNDTLGAGEVLERLNARGWSPGAANPQSYISYALTEHLKDGTFKRVDRGTYVVKNPAQFADVVAEWGGKAPKAKAAAAKASAPAKKTTKKAGGKTSKKAEGVASTDGGEVEAAATEAPVAAPVVTAETAPTAGDPQISTPQNEESAAPPVAADSAVTSPSSDATDAALQQLGIEADGVRDNPFEALT